MFNEYLFHLSDYTCSNVMCVCSTICGSNQKDFWSLCLLLEVICITHVFQKFSNFFFCVKNMFSGCFRDLFHAKVQSWVKGSNSQVFQLWTEGFTTVSQVRLTNEISWDSNQRNYQRKFPDQLLKDILWVICFKLLTSSPKPLF